MNFCKAIRLRSSSAAASALMESVVTGCQIESMAQLPSDGLL